MPKANSVMNKTHYSWLRDREIGSKHSIGTSDSLHSRLYSSIKSVGHWDHSQNLHNAVHGGVFNLEFSPDGSMLVAACEKKSILMFDPLTHKLIRGIDNAHLECVNCVRFLDSRLFATCSDDTTVVLWDARNMSQRIQTLRGHKNWVKNIEFSAAEQLIVTSGFDGSIYTWDMNKLNGEQRVFHTNGLVRMRLSPDASKMVIATTGGYLMVVHDLDLKTLSTDLQGFKPNMYRLEQQNELRYPNGENFSHLFSRSRRRNRVEFITDFPNGIEAEVISSLQIHPHGWCALSRNICHEERAEWTCVHDIQEEEPSDTEEDSATEHDANAYDPSDDDSDLDFVGFADPPSPIYNPLRTIFPSANRAATAPAAAPPPPPPPPVRRSFQVAEIVRSGGTFTANVELHVTSSDVWEALVAVREARVSRQRAAGGAGRPEVRRRPTVRVSVADNTPPPPPVRHPAVRVTDSAPRHYTGRVAINAPPVHYPNIRVAGPPPPRHPGIGAVDDAPLAPPLRHRDRKRRRGMRIHQNRPRLLNYIEEPNVGKGFIKELCFSSDGRLICSPFSFGVRLLAFSPNCAELSHCTPRYQEPVKLYEVGSNICHSNTVVSSKFSPTNCLLVSGCLNGKIVFYQPVV